LGCLFGAALGATPRAMLPVIVYNPVQHLVAGGAASLLTRKEGARANEDGRKSRDIFARDVPKRVTTEEIEENRA
jgi:hypothetical protein